MHFAKGHDISVNTSAQKSGVFSSVLGVVRMWIWHLVYQVLVVSCAICSAQIVLNSATFVQFSGFESNFRWFWGIYLFGQLSGFICVFLHGQLIHLLS